MQGVGVFEGSVRGCLQCVGLAVLVRGRGEEAGRGVLGACAGKQPAPARRPSAAPLQQSRSPTWRELRAQPLHGAIGVARRQALRWHNKGRVGAQLVGRGSEGERGGGASAAAAAAAARQPPPAYPPAARYGPMPPCLASPHLAHGDVGLCVRGHVLVIREVGHRAVPALGRVLHTRRCGLAVGAARAAAAAPREGSVSGERLTSGRALESVQPGRERAADTKQRSTHSCPPNPKPCSPAGLLGRPSALQGAGGPLQLPRKSQPRSGAGRRRSPGPALEQRWQPAWRTLVGESAGWTTGGESETTASARTNARCRQRACCAAGTDVLQPVACSSRQTGR